jgi:hypothetical protein
MFVLLEEAPLEWLQPWLPPDLEWMFYWSKNMAFAEALPSLD